MASLRHKEPSYSDKTLGERELVRLEKDGLISDVAPREGEEAFWAMDIQTQADSIANEVEVDAFITPHFSKKLDFWGMVFVNSEGHPWLSPSIRFTNNADLEPVGFVTHPGMFRFGTVPNNGVQCLNGLRFGVAEKKNFDCLILFERQLTITDAAFGRVVRYLQHLCPEKPACAILFDHRSFWLIKTYKAVVVKVQKSRWVMDGSKLLFQKFINDNISPWVERLTIACSAFGVDVVEGDTFLGRGAYGRVFKVVGEGGEILALKIVEKHSAQRLHEEKKALENAQHTGLTITPVGKIIEILDSPALLLSPVGRPLPRPTTRQEVRDLFGLLWQLHDKELIHGDPHVANVILVEEKPLWIDLVEVVEASPILKQLDAEILTSVYLGPGQ
ncbi:hypothetical protein PHYSODRAFT_503910 [Phytophthora sojae]|uniref:Protein kinase domain-containing protein n=1 Tax=Phytophthora sojae (strain P6497) TaxID=1094619 RepID=G4ZE61_PHYSP|nr:hypothetical protein PHYSODRAFT_503910 [Phytophthora sojae]EGZ17412.1 hypothetical protein PHYSODRAFT_503910 [Phytophthora sojae]|eukprot:XP_009526470.1 hypothetical protein PHYSODRAFT_503910 [Phytophthora sojae]